MIQGSMFPVDKKNRRSRGYCGFFMLYPQHSGKNRVPRTGSDQSLILQCLSDFYFGLFCR